MFLFFFRAILKHSSMLISEDDYRDSADSGDSDTQSKDDDNEKNVER